MNRLCICVTYSKDCIIKEYVGYMVKALRECCTTVCLVCNYPKVVDGLQYVQPYVDEIYYRQNIGYDSGAYRDVIIDILGWDKVLEYDELLLVNDSFWGMFFPLENYIAQMDRADCDFWGMTGEAGGEFQNPEYKFDAHIQSYFLVFKRNVLHSDVFRKFWEDFEYPVTFREAIINYELQISARLKEYGFRGLSFMDLWKIELERNVNPYYEYPYELISEKKFPLLKKKTILIRNHGFSSALKAVKYLKTNSLYPTEWIEEMIDSQFYIPDMNRTECNSLEFFYRRYSNIYIYGNGVCGKNLALYFKYKGWRFDKFIVTNKIESSPEVVTIDEAKIDSDTGIVISVMNKDVSSEIVSYIGERCCRNQLFLVSECGAIQLPT